MTIPSHKLMGLIICLVIYSCGAPDGDIDAGSHDNLKYFGFAAVDCGWDDPLDDITKTNYIDEVSGFTNIAQLCVYSESESIDNRLVKFSGHNIKAIMYIEPILFDHYSDASSPSGVRASLKQDYQTKWRRFYDNNENMLTHKHVAAIFIMDEPVWNGLSSKEYSTALELVKNDLPNIPTLSIEAYPAVNDIMAPETLDWIGFDRYDSIVPANDEAWLEDLETVKNARTRPDQKIVIVASTQWLPYYQSDAGIQPEDMESILESYYKVAAGNQGTVALIGYLWPGGLDDPTQLGARELPVVFKNTVREIGLSIIGKNQ